MKILVDTQILLWILFQSSKLTKAESALILDDDNEIICSSISLFEISLKYAIGKLELTGVTPEEIPELLQKNGYVIRDVTYRTFSSFYRLPAEIHKDPFDRILIWEAIENDWHLLTRDREIQKYRKHGLKLA